MSALLHIQVLHINHQQLTFQFSQIHPDAPLDRKLSGDDLRRTAFVLLVEFLGRMNLKNSPVYQSAPYILSMKLPTFEATGEYIARAEVLQITAGNAWEEGYFDELSTTEIRQAGHWAKIPKMTVLLELTNAQYLDGIREGMACETAFDTLVVRWWE